MAMQDSLSMNVDVVDSADADLLSSVMAMCYEELIAGLLWFVAGFLVFRLLVTSGVAKRVPLLRKLGFGGGGTLVSVATKRATLTKALSADAASGDHKSVLNTYCNQKDKVTLQVEGIQAVAQALASLEPDQAVSELSDLINKSGRRPCVLQATVESLAQSGRADLAEGLIRNMRSDGMALDLRCLEIVMSAFAKQGDPCKVQALLKASTGDIDKGMVPLTYATAIRCLLRGSEPAAALQVVLQMQQQGHSVPQPLAAELLRCSTAISSEELAQTFQKLTAASLMTVDGALVLLQHALSTEDMAKATQGEEAARRLASTLPYPVLETLLKIYVKHNEAKSLALFEELQAAGCVASEGLCGHLLARAGEARNLQFVEEVIKYAKGRSMMTLALYKTLMKVYASCDLFDQACDLYDQILADGLEPDQVMYGCLVKFAVKCGRCAQSQKFFDKAPVGDVQNYMWLIRAAGREGCPERAVELLRRLQEEQPTRVDIAVYNAVLDVCVSVKSELVNTVLAEMRDRVGLNLVSYNTLMKGSIAAGDLNNARALIGDMERNGLRPDSASYNCLLTAAVAVQDHALVWDLLSEMEGKAVPVDHYTLSILMKAARRARTARDASRLLAILDRKAINVCEDEVLLNTVLDACIYRKDWTRLGRVLDAFEQSGLKPSVHNYGLLIKAYSSRGNLRRCEELWKEMTLVRRLQPSELTLSCMLDAHICGGLVEEALKTFEHWRQIIKPNTIIYSTLIKGFASIGDAQRALEMFEEMKREGIAMNLVAYTTLIDACAKAGDVGQAQVLLKRMDEDGCQPNTITYSSIVKGHCLQGDMDAALRSFGEMLSRGLEADTVIFNTLLDGCVRNSKFDLCDQLLKEMLTYGIEPSNFTLSIVVKMWGKRRQLTQAFEAVRSAIKEKKIQVDAQVCTCLMSACFLNAAPDRALEALVEMRTWGAQGPDASTYGALITGLCRFGRHAEVAGVASEAIRLASTGHLKPLAPEVLRGLFKSLREAGADDTLAVLMDSLRGAKLPIPGPGEASAAPWGGRQSAARRR